MTTHTYANIKIGQTFSVPGENEFTLTKGRYYATCGETGVAVNIADDQAVEPFGPEPRLNDHVTEIERLALTMLTQHGSTLHPALGEWMRRLCSDPDEMRWMDHYALAETVALNDDTTPQLADFCRSEGFVIATREWDRDNWGGSAIQHCKPKADLTEEERELAEHDRAAYHLASAVRIYRENGRPDGDQTHTVMGMGAPLLTVSTSLAAACYEYHRTVLNLAYSDR